jgi:RNA polymerase sigma factor (sigma-70 family)
VVRVDDVDDATLVRLAGAGHDAAWTELVRRKSRMVWAVSRSIGLTDADASDVVQTTWLQLTQYISGLEKPECVTAWLVVTAKRESIRLLARNRRRSSVGALAAADPTNQHGPDGIEAVEGELASDGRRLAVSRALDVLPPRQRVLVEVLMRRNDYEGIAADLDMPIGSIGPTRQRALARLRRSPEILAAAS